MATRFFREEGGGDIKLSEGGILNLQWTSSSRGDIMNSERGSSFSDDGVIHTFDMWHDALEGCQYTF